MAAQRANEAANGSGEAVYVVEKARQFASLESPIVMLRAPKEVASLTGMLGQNASIVMRICESYT